MEIGDLFDEPPQDKTANVESGYYVNIDIPWKISETEYTESGNDIFLEITVE